MSLVLELHVLRLIFCNVKHVSRPSWAKASDGNICAYQNMLRDCLKNVDIPKEAISCNDHMCCNSEHFESLIYNMYANVITNACVMSAASTIPSIRQRGSRGIRIIIIIQVMRPWYGQQE